MEEKTTLAGKIVSICHSDLIPVRSYYGHSFSACLIWTGVESEITMEHEHLFSA